MAVTIAQYNHTPKLLIGQEVNLTTIKAMLLNNSAPFNAAHTTVDQVAGAASPTRANEVSGNGWPVGGSLLTNVSVSIVDINDAQLDADDVEETATAGGIGPAYACLLYDTTTGNVLWRIDFGQAQSAGSTTPFRIVWNLNGIAQVIY